MRAVIFAGPTGGHFFPAFAFAEALKKKEPQAQILFVTGRRGRPWVEKVRGAADLEFEWLPDFPFPRPTRIDFVIRLFPFLLQLARAFRKCTKILDSFQPDLAIGFGSYVAFPGLWESRRRKIPTLIHEQNRTMGRANAWASRFVDRIAVSFQNQTSPPSSPSPLWTSLPLRRALVERALQREQLDQPFFRSDRFRILLLGGSQGARALNRLWIRATELFSDEEKSEVAVIHITGEKDFKRVQTMYAERKIEARVFPFYERMEELYSQADLAITRAGAGTLFELALFALPALVFPYPHAEGHQEENAEYFEAGGGVVVLSERSASPRQLKEKVFHLIHTPSRRHEMSENLSRLAAPDASERLVEAAQELL